VEGVAFECYQIFLDIFVVARFVTLV